MEFADGGDLMAKINEHKNKSTYILEEELWKILIGTASGLKALHDRKILHRDIKVTHKTFQCANVFLTKKGEVKLGDLNVAKVAKKGLLYTQTGTPYYASPEVWKDKPYDSKSDIWSLGCIIYEAATLRPPFRGKDMKELYQRVLAGKYTEISPRYSKDMAKIIRMLLQQNPAARPSCGNILSQLEQILKLPIVAEKVDTATIDNSLAADEMLGTIRLPKNLGVLSTRLPKPNYNHEVIESVAHIGKAKESISETKKLQDKVQEAPIPSPLYKVVKDPRIQGREQRVQSGLRQNLQQRISAPSKILYNIFLTSIAHQMILFLKKQTQNKK